MWAHWQRRVCWNFAGPGNDAWNQETTGFGLRCFFEILQKHDGNSTRHHFLLNFFQSFWIFVKFLYFWNTACWIFLDVFWPIFADVFSAVSVLFRILLQVEAPPEPALPPRMAPHMASGPPAAFAPRPPMAAMQPMRLPPPPPPPPVPVVAMAPVRRPKNRRKSGGDVWVTVHWSRNLCSAEVVPSAMQSKSSHLKVFLIAWTCSIRKQHVVIKTGTQHFIFSKTRNLQVHWDDQSQQRFSLPLQKKYQSYTKLLSFKFIEIFYRHILPEHLAGQPKKVCFWRLVSVFQQTVLQQQAGQIQPSAPRANKGQPKQKAANPGEQRKPTPAGRSKDKTKTTKAPEDKSEQPTAPRSQLVKPEPKLWQWNILMHSMRL